MSNIERIKTDEHNYWFCICGNTADSSGFYTCDEAGNEIEPVINGPWDGKSLVCGQCGRIIDQDTLEVTGMRAEGQNAKRYYRDLRYTIEFVYTIEGGSQGELDRIQAGIGPSDAWEDWHLEEATLVAESSYEEDEQ